MQTSVLPVNNRRTRTSQQVRNGVIVSRKNSISASHRRSVERQESSAAISKKKPPPLLSRRIHTEITDLRSTEQSPSPSVATVQYNQAPRLSWIIPPATAESARLESSENGKWIPPTVQMLVLKPLNAVEIRTRCIFLRVGEIDTLNERYYGEILFEASWNDIKLKNKTTYDPSVGHWNPNLVILNSIGDVKHETSYSIYEDGTNIPEITEHHRIKGTFWERMELYHFPADVQELSLTMTTTRRDDELRFFQNYYKPSGVIRTIFTDEQEWYLYEHCEIHIQEPIEEFSDNGDRIKHGVVVCTCHVARKCGYFFWNLYFLVFLITSASFCTFAIPITNTHGRVQVACTLLLTSVTFRWTVNKSLPTISYLTAVDIYAIGSIFALCLLNIYHGVIGYINYYKSTNDSNVASNTTAEFALVIIDRYTLVVFSALYFSYQILIVFWMWRGPWKKRRLMNKKDSTKKYNYLRQSLKPPPSPLLNSNKPGDVKTITSTLIQDLE
ncbi:unnamed protein product [Didymodactylos carnosus]|uniref:Uncharacterized protein n=1 Tax=Didymodactylos carnosus TaxID=1234261 RepID=A0A814GEX3_9BILA|nr:unnamed protein product [Didymodactylos carnosus]CAF0995463.1 unnamed protein product [Didymodactylos carnosus]CAF3652433.1 unnamed protein product [Didymodactylos carnosus]CAF3767140.1 unnamed protein product [Didymodactylos carnosus]